MRAFKKVAFILYPVGIALLLPILLSKDAHAGRIRKLELDPARPGVVVLAFEKSTSITFRTRPDKVVPGAPTKVQIDFVTATAITVTPVGRNPGNLHVFTRSGHYVILFQMGNDSNYDDAIEVVSAIRTRPIRLNEDTYRVVGIRLNIREKSAVTDAQEATCALSNEGKQISGEELLEKLSRFRPLRCQGCLNVVDGKILKISCLKSIEKISCTGLRATVAIERMPSP